MADFKAHTSVETLWGLLLGTVSVISDFCSLIGGIVILFLAATSSAAPDIDSDTDVQAGRSSYSGKEAPRHGTYKTRFG